MTTGFTRVGTLSDFPQGRGRAVMVNGVRVAVFRIGDRLFALGDACPHMGASLADYGKLESAQVVCHWHGWKFDLVSGQGDQRSWACADVYEIQHKGEEIWLKPPIKPEREEPRPPAEEWIKWDPDRFFKKKKPD